MPGKFICAAGSRWAIINLQSTWISGRDRESFRRGCLFELPHQHLVDASVDGDLGMFAIADIAAEDPGATFPQDRHAGAPDRDCVGGRHRAAGVPLAGLAGLAAGKSGPTSQCIAALGSR